MRKCLPEFSRIFECGAGQAATLKKWLFMVSRLYSKGANVHDLIFNFGSFLPKDARVHIVDLVKRFRTSIYL